MCIRSQNLVVRCLLRSQALVACMCMDGTNALLARRCRPGEPASWQRLRGGHHNCAVPHSTQTCRFLSRRSTTWARQHPRAHLLDLFHAVVADAEVAFHDPCRCTTWGIRAAAASGRRSSLTARPASACWPCRPRLPTLRISAAGSTRPVPAYRNWHTWGLPRADVAVVAGGASHSEPPGGNSLRVCLLSENLLLQP